MYKLSKACSSAVPTNEQNMYRYLPCRLCVCREKKVLLLCLMSYVGYVL